MPLTAQVDAQENAPTSASTSVTSPRSSTMVGALVAICPLNSARCSARHSTNELDKSCGARQEFFQSSRSRLFGKWVVFQKWRWTEIAVTLGLVFVASSGRNGP